MRLVVTLGVALLAIIGAATAKPSTAGSCSKNDEGIKYGIASNCQKYLVCKKGVLEVKECDDKKYYDTVTGKCLKAAAATCAVESNPEPEPQPEPVPVPEPEENDDQYDYLCQKVLYGVRIHPNACDSYLVCNKEKATVEHCAAGFIFVADIITCVPGNKVTCTIQIEEPTTTESLPSTSSQSNENGSEESGSNNESSESSNQYDYLCATTKFGSLAHPETCTKYISCSKNKAKEENCKKGYAYSTTLHLCVKQKNGGCADAPEEQPPTEASPVEPEPTRSGSEEKGSGEESSESSNQYDYLCATTKFGSVAHPETCTKYISCSKNKAKEENCKKGYAYSTTLHLCVKQKNGGCADAPEEQPPTEASPVEPEPTRSGSEEKGSGEESSESSNQYDYLCATTKFGSVAHPETCTKYISCSKNKAKEENCKKGYAYSTTLHLCVKQKNGGCADAPEEQPPTEASPVEPEPTRSGSEEKGSGEESSESSNQYDYLCATTKFGSVAHPETCTKYISCSKNKAKEENCKKGYAYSTTLHLCVKQKNGGCADAPEEQPPTEASPVEPEPTRSGSEEKGSGEESSESSNQYDYLCATTKFGSVAHPETCTKYISCSKNKAKEENCKKGYAYSTTLHQCVKQKNGGCADAPEEQPPTEASPVEPEPTRSGSEEKGSGEESSESSNQYDYLCATTKFGSVAHPETCTKYISCSKNKAKEENCKKGYAYSTTLHLCVKQKNGGCADAPEEQPPTEASPVEPEPTRSGSEEKGSGEESSESSNQYDYLCATTKFGSVAHPETCTKYISCSKNKAKEENCKKGYAYSITLHLCVKQKNGGCADAPEEQPPTEASPVEPEPTRSGSEEKGSGEETSESSNQYDYLCATTKFGSVAHPETCTKYISCSKNKAKEENCKKGYAYSTTLHLCVKQKNGGCADAPEEQPPTEASPVEPEPTRSGSEEKESGEESSESSNQYDYLCATTKFGSVAHPETCTKYISCSKNKAKEENCKKGYAYSTTLHLCVKQKNGGCADAPEEQPPTEASPVEPEPTRSGSEEKESGEESSESSNQYDYLCATTKFGSVAHPETCTKYISCSKNKAKEENCKKGYAYSITLHLCVKQKNGGCADAPEEQPPTETSPVEPEPTRSGSEEKGSGEETSESSNQYDYLCATTKFGSVAHPETCTKYISCSKNKAKEENCKKGYAYSTTLHLCVKQKNGGCADAPEEQPPTEASPVEPEPTRSGSEEKGSGEETSESSNQYDYLCATTKFGSVAHPETCTKYISCSKNKAKEENCKKGYAYSTTLHLCVKQKNGGCADAPEEQPPTEASPVEPEPTRSGSEEKGSGEESSESSNQYDYLCATTKFGSVAHPETCTKYISCSKNKAKEENCKKGYAYSTTLHLCVKQKNGGCADAPEEQPTTTHPPQTTEAPTTTPKPPKPTTQTTTTTQQPQTTEAPTTTAEPPKPTDEITTTTQQPQTTEAPTTSTEFTPPATGGDPGEFNQGCVEGFTGYIPIENDCTSYVYCFQGEPGVRTCLEEYIYYDPFKACLPGDPVLCQLYSV